MKQISSVIWPKSPDYGARSTLIVAGVPSIRWLDKELGDNKWKNATQQPVHCGQSDLNHKERNMKKLIRKIRRKLGFYTPMAEYWPWIERSRKTGLLVHLLDVNHD